MEVDLCLVSAKLGVQAPLVLPAEPRRHGP